MGSSPHTSPYLVLAAGVLLACAQTTPRVQDALPSWNDTAAKEAIITFVEQITTEGSPDFVPVPERIAAFDNDGVEEWIASARHPETGRLFNGDGLSADAGIAGLPPRQRIGKAADDRPNRRQGRQACRHSQPHRTSLAGRGQSVPSLAHLVPGSPCHCKNAGDAS
jgi:hypothetical protein